MRINGGWARIGVVLSIVYGLLVVVIAFQDQPRLNQKESLWFSEAADVIAEVISKTEGQKVQSSEVAEALLKGSNAENIAWLEKVAASPSESQKTFSAQVAKVNEKQKTIIASLLNEQITYWLLAFIWWVIGVSLLFAAGLSIRWIYRGFRPLPVA